MTETDYPRARSRAGRLFALRAVGVGALGWSGALIAIVLLGAALRFHGLDFDTPAGASEPIQLHPDERFISFVSNNTDWPRWRDYFDTAESPLNPYNAGHESFVYGTLPLFLVKGVSTLAGDDPAGPGNSYGKDVQWGRRVTAFVDTLTILLVAAAGTVLFSRTVGLVAALAYALAVLPTQLAHFWAADLYVTFFATATLLCSALAVRAQRTPVFAVFLLLAGAALGLAMASKVSALPVALLPAAAVAIRVGLRDVPSLGLCLGRQRGDALLPAPQAGHWLNDLAILFLAAWVSLLAFRVAQPYAFVGPNIWDLEINAQWWDDIQRERELQSGNVDYPPFVQFAGRTPFVEPLRQIALWGFGPGLTALAAFAAGAALWLSFKRRDLSFVLPLVLAFGVFAFNGGRFVAFMRYFAPMYPALALFAAWGATTLWRSRPPTSPGGLRLGRLRIPGKPLHLTLAARALAVAALVAAAWWAIAFQNVYLSTHPRIEASQWIYEHIPAGARLTSEIWDDALPLRLPGRSSVYVNIETDPYRTDTPEKIRQLVFGIPGADHPTGLDAADYVIISSNRVRDSVVRLEREYPATIRYYELLDSGELGFREVARFSTRPSFLGISIDDSGAEESFTVYDHPEVVIYQKTDAWDADRALALLFAAYPDRAVNLVPAQGGTNGLHLTAAEAAVQQAGGTFSEIVDADGFTSRLPWLWWFLWIEVAAFATLPLVTWLFRSLPDHGYGLTKTLGVVAVGAGTWLAVAWGLADFSGTLAWAALAALIVAGLAVGLLRRRTLAADARAAWPAWLALEVVFVAAFALFLTLRAWNPDLWHPFRGGEKPMELAYLTAIVRSTRMPPFDPWFAGGSMNYYYMGWFLVAVPIRALRIVPEVAFNLAVPTYAAMATVTAASVAQNLVALARRRRHPFSPAHTWRRPAIVAGILGAVLLSGIGNLDGAHQTVERFQAVNSWSFLEGVPGLGGLVGLVGGLYEYVFLGTRLPPFDWWRSSRVHIGSFDITEFPYWTFLFADLHPHLMDLPVFGLTVATALGYVVAAVRRMQPQTWALAGLLGFEAGLVRTVHTWDFPTAVLIVAGAIALGQLLARDRWDLRWWRFLGHGLLAAAVMIVAFAPYTARTEVFDAGLQRAPETTKANQYFAHFGLFVTAMAVFVAYRTWEEWRARNGRRGRNPVFAVVAGRWEVASLALFLAGLTLFTWRFGLTVVALSAVALIFIANLLWLEVRARDPDVPRTVATALFGLAVGIAGGVDVVTVKDDIVRMNTVFKFSMQAWQLYALATAFAAWYLGTAIWDVRGRVFSVRPGRRWLAWTLGPAAAALFAGSLVFVVSGTLARQSERFADLGWGLDGFAYLDAATYREPAPAGSGQTEVELVLAEDAVLFDWLRENVDGSPVIAEMVGPLYRWTGRVSMHTGLPAVIGWDWHQVQQRRAYEDLVRQRRADTELFFTVADPLMAERYLRKYDVTYVIWGTEERARANPEVRAMLEGLDAVEVAFAHGDNAILRVDQSKLVLR